MFEFLIDTLKGEPILGDLENVGACYPDDDVIYMFGIPCRLSSARSQSPKRAANVCPACFGDCERLHADGLMHKCMVCNGTGKRP
jgi:hypothetical protein